MDEATGQPAWFQRVVEKESCFPPDVQRRLRALRKIQLRMVILDGEFYREVYNVLAKCHNLYDEFYQRRADIISGAYEPTERDCEWDDEFPENMKGDYSLPGDEAEGGAGLPKAASKTPEEKKEMNAGVEAVKDEQQGKEEASSKDEICKAKEGEKEVKDPTELAGNEKEKMMEEAKTNDETSKTEERKEPDEAAGLTERGKEEIVQETRTSDEISKTVEERKEANEPAGLAEGGKEEMTEDKKAKDEVPPKTEEVKEANEPVGLAEGGKESVGLADGGKEPVGLAEGGKEPVGLAEGGKEPVGLAEGGKEEKSGTKDSPESKSPKSDKDKKGAKAEALDKRNSEEIRGIPDFWLTIFMNIEMLRDMVEERDKPVLSHLIDVRTVYHDEDKPMGFTLEFHFTPNNYFTNTVLTKDYDLILRWHNHDPFMFHGPKMTGCRGCTINWKEGKNVTTMEITKKQTHKRRGTKRTVTRVVKVKSFFDFFSPPPIPEDPDDLDEESLQILRRDCQVAHYLWDGVNPSPLLFYTGEIWDRDDLDAYYFTEIEGGGDDEV